MILKLEKNYCRKSPIFLEDVDIEKVSVSKKISFGENNYKYFTGYLHNDHNVTPFITYNASKINNIHTKI